MVAVPAADQDHKTGRLGEPLPHRATPTGWDVTLPKSYILRMGPFLPRKSACFSLFCLGGPSLGGRVESDGCFLLLAM